MLRVWPVNKLLDTLPRLGAVQLAKMLGEKTVSLLELLGLKQLQSSNLAELLLSQIGEEGILLAPNHRLELLDALAEDDAKRLCRLIGIAPKPDAWQALRRQSFPKGSSAAETLFAFFGYNPPISEAGYDVRPSNLVNPSYGLFSHQIDACRECIKYLELPSKPRVLLHMPTGAGKTRTAMNVLAHFFREKLDEHNVIIWLAHSEELCEQAAGEFERAWGVLGNRPLNVYRAFGPSRIDLETIRSGMLIGGLQLLYRRSLSEQSEFLKLAQKVSVVVMDEAHQAIAPTYRHLINMLMPTPNTALLGLSATPGRDVLDASKDMELALFFHRQKVTLQVPGYDNPVIYLQDQGYLAEVDYEYIRYSPGADITLTTNEIKKLERELDLPESVILRLGQDHKRNFLIVTKLMEESKSGDKIIVFACSVEHAHIIAGILAARGIDAAAITSRTRPARRRQLIESYRQPHGTQILCNYGVLTTGFDAPKTKCALIARPTQSVVLYSQMVGRASRGPKVGGNKQCKIITVVDQLPGFRSVAEAFEYFEEIWI